jgi:hypothetical protein
MHEYARRLQKFNWNLVSFVQELHGNRDLFRMLQATLMLPRLGGATGPPQVHQPHFLLRIIACNSRANPRKSHDHGGSGTAIWSIQTMVYSRVRDCTQ